MKKKEKIGSKISKAENPVEKNVEIKGQEKSFVKIFPDAEFWFEKKKKVGARGTQMWGGSSCCKIPHLIFLGGLFFFWDPHTTNTEKRKEPEKKGKEKKK